MFCLWDDKLENDLQSRINKSTTNLDGVKMRLSVHSSGTA